MNRSQLFPSLIASLLLFVGTLRAAEESKPVPVKKPEIIQLVDFRSTPNSFAYGSWAQSVSPGKDGLAVVKGADGKGGCGSDCALSLEDSKYIEIGLATGVANEVPQVQIVLEDSDGTNASWRVAVGQLVPSYPVWLRAPVAGMKIEKPGSDGVLNVTKIVKWHLQGDYSTEKPMHFVAIALRARR